MAEISRCSLKPVVLCHHWMLLVRPNIDNYYSKANKVLVGAIIL